VNGRSRARLPGLSLSNRGETELVIEVRKHSGEDWELQIGAREAKISASRLNRSSAQQCANEWHLLFLQRQSAGRASIALHQGRTMSGFLFSRNYTTLTSITED